MSTTLYTRAYLRFLQRCDKRKIGHQQPNLSEGTVVDKDRGDRNSKKGGREGEIYRQGLELKLKLEYSRGGFGGQDCENREFTFV
jgi:hypothetical protein